MMSPNVAMTGLKFDYPVKNDLIATDFNVLPPNMQLSDEPMLLMRWPECTDLWYKKDDKFERPKSIVDLNIYTNDCLWLQKPESRVFAEIWNKVINEYLREFNYEAELAKLNNSITLGHDYIHFKWKGFNHKLPVFINQTLQKVKQMKNEDMRQVFEQVKVKLLQDWKNFYLEQTYRQASPTFDTIFINLKSEKKQLRKSLENFTYEMYQEYLKDWMVTGRSVWYVSGNYAHDKAIELVENSRTFLDLKTIKIEELPDVRAVALEPKISF